MDKANDYSGLIDDAAKDIERRQEGGKPAQKRPGGGSLVAWLLAVIALDAGLVGQHLWQQHAAPSRQTTEQSLQQAVDLAQRAVEAYRKAEGSLPSVLPNASLAATVDYRLRGTDYQLSASGQGISVVRAWDGKLETTAAGDL